MDKEEFILKILKEKGFCDAGICGAEPFYGIKETLEKNKELLKGFAEENLEKRIDPKLTMENAKALISVAKNYNTEIKVKADNALRGYISAGALGEDYHVFMKRELEDVSEKIEKKFNCSCMAFSDTGPLSDREVALRSGIGYIGKNSSVVTDNGGSAVFLGYIITDLELKAGEKSKNTCGRCQKCIFSCPTGAISEEGFEIKKCISYITQIKVVLSLEEMKIIGRNLYGCDVCQLVCPKNKDALIKITDIDHVMPKIQYILSLSNKEFNKIYKPTAMGWRGNTIIKRNALAVLGNIGKKESLRLLEKYLTHENKVLRHTAIRSVINICEKEKETLLKKCLENEKDEQIRSEIKWAIGIQEG